MQFSDLQTLARLYTAGAKKTVINDVQLKLIINQGAIDVATLSKCMPKTKTFDVTGSQRDYSLPTIASDYVAMDKSGVWLYNGSQWKEIEKKTKKYLDERYTNWRSMGESFPIFYYMKGDTLSFYKTPDETRASGGELNYFRKGQTMTDDSDTPFHVDGDKTTEITSLLTLSDSILDYVRWKLSEPLSKGTEEIISRQKEYYSALRGRMNAINEEIDLNSSRKNKRRVK